MNEKQFSKAKRLIRRLCANCVHGCCLLLDDGCAPCPCPQLLSRAVLCQYFRAAVLPTDRGLWTEVLHDSPQRRCVICGTPILRFSNAVKYCPDCAVRERRKRDTARKRKSRRAVRK